MKRININSQQTHFIGCWNLENNELCNEIINLFENNKSLQQQGVTDTGKNPKIKKPTTFYKIVQILFTKCTTFCKL